MNFLKEWIKKINDKKQYINKVKNQIDLLGIKRKKVYKSLPIKFKNQYKNSLKYVIIITFARKNTLLHVLDCSNNLIFFRSAGLFKYSSKKKKNRLIVFRQFCNALFSQLKLKKKPLTVLHFKNVKSFKKSIIKYLRRKFLIKSVKHFNNYAYNGCKKKKMRRKKMRRKK